MIVVAKAKMDATVLIWNSSKKIVDQRRDILKEDSIITILHQFEWQQTDHWNYDVFAFVGSDGILKTLYFTKDRASSDFDLFLEIIA